MFYLKTEMKMTLDELKQLALKLHKKANASSGISPREDKNEWIAEKIDSIIEEDSYALEDILNEDKNEEQVLQYVEELYEESKKKM